MDANPRRLVWAILSVMLIAFGAVCLLACSAGPDLIDALPPSRGELLAAEKGMSDVIDGVQGQNTVQVIAGGLSILAGALLFVKRALKKYDEAPFEDEEGNKVSEGDIVRAVTGASKVEPTQPPAS